MKRLLHLIDPVGIAALATVLFGIFVISTVASPPTARKPLPPASVAARRSPPSSSKPAEAAAPPQAVTPVVVATTATAPATPAAPPTPDPEQVWHGCLDTLLDAQVERMAAGKAVDARLCQVAARCVTAAGAEACVETMLSFNATFSTDDSLRSLVRRGLDEHLVAIDELKAAEKAEVARLESTLDAIDERTLVELGYDVDLTAALADQSTVPMVHVCLDREVALGVNRLLNSAKEAHVKQIATTAGGMAAGHLVGQAASNSMRDEEGNLSGAAILGSFLVEIAADVATSAVAEQVGDTSGTLRSEVLRVANDLVDSYVRGDAARERYNVLNSRVWRHDRAIAAAIAAEIHLSPEVAQAQLYRASKARRAAHE